MHPGTATNGPDEQTRAWIQAILHNWETICRRYLYIELEPLPWMIFYDNGTKSFFVLALPSVVRALAGADNQNLDKLFLGLAGHELAHTRQLIDVMRRIKTLREKHDVPIGIDDNFIQKTYSADVGGRSALCRGARHFRAAMEDSDHDTSRRLVLEALSIAERRRGRFFTGAPGPCTPSSRIFFS